MKTKGQKKESALMLSLLALSIIALLALVHYESHVQWFIELCVCNAITEDIEYCMTLNENSF